MLHEEEPQRGEIPYIDSLKGERLNPDHFYTSKAIFQHKDDPNLLILEAENFGFWGAENEEAGDDWEAWTDEQKHHYYLLQYWVRRLLHDLLPQHFPRIHAIDYHHMIVGKVEGEVINWHDIDDSHRQGFLRNMDMIGLLKNTLDKEDNFIINPDGYISYIDDIDDTFYFTNLGRFQRYGTAAGPISERDRAMHEQLEKELGVQPTNVRIFDLEKLQAYLDHKTKVGEMSLQQRMRVEKMLARIYELIDSFPKIDLPSTTE